MTECCEVVVITEDDLVLIEQTIGDIVIVENDGEILVNDTDIEIVILEGSDIVVVDDSVGPQGPQGPPGPAGAGATVTAPAAENITAYKVVAMDPSGQFYLADPLILSDSCYVVGVSLFSALTGEPLDAQTDGVMITPAIWSPGPLFLGPGGTLVTSSPLAGFALPIAVAATTTQLIIRPQFAIDLA